MSTDDITPIDDLADAEIIKALKRHRGKRDEAAKALGISRTTLWRRIEALKNLLTFQDETTESGSDVVDK
jgi:transcriptional regulator of acetoin/glycerol metabolism